MSHSFDKIDYSVRPAKYAERRMLRDVFRKLSPFQSLEEYHYVGLGSVWFSDYTLFHRSLGVRTMTSIEKALSAKDRVNANRPFRIEVKFGHTSGQLPKIDWTKRAFVWLDYDEAIRPEMLRDIQTVSKKLRSGSILAVTVKGGAAREIDQVRSEIDNGETADIKSAADRFANNFSDWSVGEVTNLDLEGQIFARFSRRLIYSVIQQSVATRKATELGTLEDIRICDFEYADGAPMTTTVSLIVGEKEKDVVSLCQFDDLDFLMNSDDGVVEIEIPKITPLEYRILESQLPLQDKELDLQFIPKMQAKRFVEFYRYLPNFAALET